jgi:chemotaxis signal transduction protein
MERNDKARVHNPDDARDSEERLAGTAAGAGEDEGDRDGQGRAQAQATQATMIAGLECRVGKAPIVVPVAHVAQIIEYETSPLPLTRRWITGVGIHGERLVMTVGLVTDAAGKPPAVRRRTKGILLNTPDDGARAGRPGRASAIAWALEVQEVLVLVRATLIERRRSAPRAGELPPWIARARTADGRSMGWIDVPAMLADFSTASAAPALALSAPLARPLA